MDIALHARQRLRLKEKTKKEMVFEIVGFLFFRMNAARKATASPIRQQRTQATGGGGVGAGTRPGFHIYQSITYRYLMRGRGQREALAWTP
jgi:hypothetical protein